MNYSEFIEQVTNQLGLIDYLESIELTRDEMQFAYIAYTNFNINVRESIKLTLELKKK